jgi:hypothetical protein
MPTRKKPTKKPTRKGGRLLATGGYPAWRTDSPPTDRDLDKWRATRAGRGIPARQFADLRATAARDRAAAHTEPTTKRRPTIGADPLDALVPPRAERRRQEREADRQQAAGDQRRRADALVAAKAAPARPAPAPPKVRATFHLPREVLDAARDAAVALSGPPVRLTLAHLAEIALRREVARLGREHHGGKPFPTRGADLKGGRPIKGT